MPADKIVAFEILPQAHELLFKIALVPFMCYGTTVFFIHVSPGTLESDVWFAPLGHGHTGQGK